MCSNLKKAYLLIALIGSFLLPACHQQEQDNSILQARLDSLQHRVDNAYKPGLGEFMSDIQVHHAKLWFAGSAQNWRLADFEIGEIREALSDIQQYCINRPEIASLPMILPAVDSVSRSVTQENLPKFKATFLQLTNTCNNCHRATKHEFNVIRVPEAPPFTNQVFEKQR